MNEREQRPGVMLYFDTLVPVLNRISGDQCLDLMRGIVNYVQTGEVPELDAIASFAFDMLRPSIDKDGERYEQKKEDRRIHGKFMAYRRELKRQGVKEEDLPSEADYKDMLADANSNYQLQTAADSYININITPTLESATASKTAATSISASSTAEKTSSTGASGGCKGGENLRDLRDRWNEALDAGNMEKACTLAQRLAGLGYDADQRTRQLTPRT